MTAPTEDARATLADHVGMMRPLFQACWGLLYADGNRERPPRFVTAEDQPRSQKCGGCEHPVTDHDPECGRCSCPAATSMPSTVGHGLWTGPGKAESVYIRAVAELQRTHDAIRHVKAVPTRWDSSALHRAPSNTQPMPIREVMDGVDLLTSALCHVGADLTDPEAEKLKEAAGHAEAAVAALRKAEDPIDEVEWRELSQPRCVVPGCGVTVAADGLCKEHHEASPEELASLERCVHCRSKPPEPHRKWCARCRRGHQPDRMSCVLSWCELNRAGREAS